MSTVFATHPVINNCMIVGILELPTAIYGLNVASDLDLHCLPFIQQFLDTSTGSKMCLFGF